MAAVPKRRKSGAIAILPPAEWRALSPGRKLEYLLGCSLDDAYVIAHWKPTECDLHQMAAKQQLIAIMIKHGFKFALDAYRDQERGEALRLLADALDRRHTRNADLSVGSDAGSATIATPIGTTDAPDATAVLKGKRKQ